ncbi:MAG: tetratricopeptide repeat protein [Pedobacter sp.]|nr:MAG: tetratricopeptide repeat protein [Pedobacter sp.]
MKHRLLFLLVLFSSLLHAQNPKLNFAEKERTLKKIVASNPDSARVIIKQILSFKGEHDTVYASTYIFYGYYHNLKANLDSALYYYNKAQTYTDNYPNFYARVLRNKAAVYRKKSDYTQSLALLEIAENKYKATGDETGLAMVYGEIASNYNQMVKSEKSIPYLLKAIAILEKKKDKVNLPPLKQNLANTYMTVRNFAFAIDLYKEALAGFKAINSTKNYYLTLINYGDCHIYLKKNAEAKKILLEAIRGLEKYNDSELVGVALSKLGRLENDEGDRTQALSYYKSAYEKMRSTNSSKLLRTASEYMTVLRLDGKLATAMTVAEEIDRNPIREKSNLEDKLVYESEKTKLYQSKNDEEKVAVGLKNTVALLDTLSKNNDKAEVMHIQAQYQNAYQQKQSHMLKQKNEALVEKTEVERNKKVLPAVAATSVFLVIAVMYRRKKKNHRLKVRIAKADKMMLQRKYEKEKQINQELKSDIKSKQSELMSNAMTLASVQDSINLIIKMYGDNLQTEDIDAIKADLRELITDKDYWTLFKKRFDEVYADFQENLLKLYPQLTKNDLFFCSILSLNLSSKETAKLLQVSPESIVKKKYRIKKRMEIESEKDFETILAANAISSKINKAV